MKKRYFFLLMGLVLALSINQLPAQDQIEDHIHGPIMIIDTDMGLDDAVTLALALQSPDIHLETIICGSGVCSAEQSSAYLNRMIVEFNRSDIMLYNASKRQPASPPPPFRDFAQNALTAALPDPVPNMAHLFDAYAYKAHNHSPVTLLALGPLSNLADALAADPGVKNNIQKIILPGPPDPEQNWNLQFDRQAYEIVRQSQIPMVFISNETAAAAKPDAWRSGPVALGPNTSLGENFFRRLLAPPPVRQHYTTKLENFYDELAFLAALRPDLFQEDQQKQLLRPINQDKIVAALGPMLSAGRQRKARVVFTEQPFPDNLIV